MSSNEVYELFYNLSTDLMCIAGEDGYFKQLNPAWTSTLGWTKEELLSVPLSSFIHPDDVEKTFREVARQLNGESTEAFINRYRCKDGSYRWLEWRATPASEGTLVANATDVTEQKNAEKKIHNLAYTDPDTGMPNEAACALNTASAASSRFAFYLKDTAIQETDMRSKSTPLPGSSTLPPGIECEP